MAPALLPPVTYLRHHARVARGEHAQKRTSEWPPTLLVSADTTTSAPVPAAAAEWRHRVVVDDDERTGGRARGRPRSMSARSSPGFDGVSIQTRRNPSYQPAPARRWRRCRPARQSRRGISRQGAVT